MREYLSSPAGPRSWPDTAPGGPATENPAAGRAADIAELISFAGDTRRLGYTAAGLLAAVLVGTAAVGAALAVHGRTLALGSVVLLLPVLISWLITAVLLLLSESPLSAALGELRRATGAVVDTSAPWSPLDALTDAEITWDFVVPLIGAAGHQHTRARMALGAAVFTTMAFAVWMALSLAAITLV